MPTGWAIEPLSEALDSIMGGGTPNKGVPEYFQGSIPLMTVKDMKVPRPDKTGFNITEKALANSSAKLVPADTIIIATRMGLGKVVRPVMPTAINQDLKALFPSEAVDKSFLEHWLVSIASKIESMGTGTTVKGVRLNQIRELELPIPPLNEQRRIVEKIETLFARIDQGEAALRQVQTLLARYRQSVLKAAVTGQLTADWRAENAHRLEPGQDLLQRILQTRRETWKGRGKYKEPTAPDTTHLPKLPEGWVWALSEQITTKITDGTHHSPPNGQHGKYKYVTAKNIKDSGIDLSNITYVSEETHKQIYSRCDVRKDDILYIKDGATTGVCTVNRLEEEFSLLSSVGVLRPGRGIESDFLKLVLDSPEIRKNLLGRMSGSAITRLTITKLKQIPIPLPSTKEQQAIVERASSVLKQIDGLQAYCQTELTRSNALRQSILKQAFAGRLVPQDPNDEPASELLARIRADKPAAKGKTHKKVSA